jgi:uncharacterized protein YbjT (DUF2867 family)
VIVVTGATGAVGGLVARELAERGERFRMIVRDPSRAPDLPGGEIAIATYDDQEALAAALSPGDRVFMVSMHSPYDERLALHRSFIEVAARQQVARVVYLSYVAAGANAHFVHARSHGATEAMLEESGVPWSAVRNGMYSDEIASWFDADGRITGPGADGRISLSYRPELGKAIAILLTEPAHDDRSIFTVTNPEAVTLSELAALAEEVSGDPYRYEPLPREEWIEYRRRLGREEWSIEAGISYYDGVAVGEADVVSDDYERLTGQPAKSIRELLEMFRDELPLSGTSVA